jgi:hypothetical protein
MMPATPAVTPLPLKNGGAAEVAPVRHFDADYLPFISPIAFHFIFTIIISPSYAPVRHATPLWLSWHR